MVTGYRKYALIFWFLGMMLTVTPVYGADWYVAPGIGSGGDGSSWLEAFRTIQQAVNACSSSWMICMGPTDRIHVRQGTYLLTSPINIGKHVTILGGYSNKGIRSWENFRTIIDGQNLTHCFNITGPAIIDGFFIQYGSNIGDGGGLNINSTPTYCTTGEFYHVPKIRNCVIENNAAGGLGGGIYDFESNTEIENCIFQGNTADAGGGVYQSRSSVTFKKCIFRENESTALGSTGGGAICGVDNHPVTEGLTHIINCLFDGNAAASWGGAIATTQIFPRIWNSTFFNNSAGISGGAYHNNVNSDAPFVRNSIFWENSPDQLDVNTSNPYYYVSQSDVQGGWTGRGVDNIDEDPDFVSPGTGDFHLELGSPCIDTGYRWGMPEEDLDGVLRPHDGNGDGTAEWDMGSYEFYRFTLPGDFDWDWDVDGRNLPVFGGSFGSELGDYAYNASCDFDENGLIDEDDLSVFADRFGEVGSP